MEKPFVRTVHSVLVRACVRTYTCRYCCAYVQLLSFSRFFPPFLFSVFHFSSFLFQPPKTSSIKLKFSLTKFSIVTLFYYTVQCTSLTSPCNVPIWNTTELRALKKKAIGDGKSFIVAPAVQDDIFRTSQQTRLVKAAAIVHSHVAQDSIPLLIISHSDW